MPTVIEAWQATLGYTFQLYFDFAGYTDMALGIALILGIVLPENFRAPYRATSIQDFWRRWHITLSLFLRDYLYISFGGNRYGLPRQVLALFATMALGGLWHGAGWTFVAWGAAHGAALGLHLLWRKSGRAHVRHRSAGSHLRFRRARLGAVPGAELRGGLRRLPQPRRLRAARPGRRLVADRRRRRSSRRSGRRPTISPAARRRGPGSRSAAALLFAAVLVQVGDDAEPGLHLCPVLSAPPGAGRWPSGSPCLALCVAAGRRARRLVRPLLGVPRDAALARRDAGAEPAARPPDAARQDAAGDEPAATTSRSSAARPPITASNPADADPGPRIYNAGISGILADELPVMASIVASRGGVRRVALGLDYYMFSRTDRSVRLDPALGTPLGRAQCPPRQHASAATPSATPGCTRSAPRPIRGIGPMTASGSPRSSSPS